jgi:hypothetical protein
MTNYYNIHNPADVRDLSSQMAQWLADGNPKANDWAEQPHAPTDNAQWVDGQWVIPPAPTYTAGEWLEMVGLGTSQQPTLIYLKLQLMAAQKSSIKLTAIECYVNGILAQYAVDNSPKEDWGQPPYTIQETIAECVNLLQS